MELRRDEFPVALQAYEVRGEREDFIAEQVVNSQVEADNFMSLYAGRLIKTRDLRPVETKRFDSHRTTAIAPRRRAVISPWLIFLLVLIVLVIIGFATGWLQTMIGQTK
ncbi:MAG TPA: hypothetical protein VGQ09_13140 [Chitinophagaceae bacterium]|jgi:hypothetical protein|nr:hypothetical protein [Chitinophagaceae bacterium]